MSARVLFETRRRLAIRALPDSSSAQLVQIVEVPSKTVERVLHEGTEADCERMAKVVMEEWGGLDRWREVE